VRSNLPSPGDSSAESAEGPISPPPELRGRRWSARPSRAFRSTIEIQGEPGLRDRILVGDVHGPTGSRWFSRFDPALPRDARDPSVGAYAANICDPETYARALSGSEEPPSTTPSSYPRNEAEIIALERPMPGRLRDLVAERATRCLRVIKAPGASI